MKNFTIRVNRDFLTSLLNSGSFSRGHKNAEVIFGCNSNAYDLIY